MGGDSQNLLGTLGPREAEVLGKLAEGKNKSTIAAEIGIAERTVTTHLTNIFKKLQIQNSSAAIQIYLEATPSADKMASQPAEISESLQRILAKDEYVDVLRRIAEGKTTQQISQEIDKSVASINKYRAAISEITGIKSAKGGNELAHYYRNVVKPALSQSASVPS